MSRIFFVYKKIFFCDVTKHETSSTHPSTLNHYNTYNKYSVSDHNIRKLKPGFRGNFRPLLSSMMVYNILKKIKHTLFLHLMHAFSFMYILVLSQNGLAVWLICSIIFRILRGTNMKPFIFSACNMRIHYGYITIRRKFREKKIDSVVRWIFWWITFYNVQKKQNARQKVGSWWISELNEKSKYDDEEVHASFTTF